MTEGSSAKRTPFGAGDVAAGAGAAVGLELSILTFAVLSLGLAAFSLT